MLSSASWWLFCLATSQSSFHRKEMILEGKRNNLYPIFPPEVLNNKARHITRRLVPKNEHAIEVIGCNELLRLTKALMTTTISCVTSSSENLMLFIVMITCTSKSASASILTARYSKKFCKMFLCLSIFSLELSR